MPCHTRRTHAPSDRECEGASAWQHCHETSYCNPVKKNKFIIKKENRENKQGSSNTTTPPPQTENNNQKMIESSLYEGKEYFARFHSPLDDAAFLYA